jgi:hypothetical protein
MASFTDNPQALSTFNPYIQQLPVSQMVEVGLKKQKQYDEGIQKIQTNIDNIAGLSIGRDVDKAYLQTKINELGNNLKIVGAGDFSDFQLVNSVNGMTTQIAKDPYIQAAVMSTTNDSKQMAMIEEARQKGTLTPHAEYNYQLQRNAYYDSSDLKNKEGNPITFSGKYTPSWDIDKNILEAIKAVGDSTWTADNVFKLDGNGRPMYNKDGSPMYSEFAIKEKRAGKFNENISAAIDSVLSRPEAKQELSMQGVYNYRGYNDVNSFVQQYEKEKQKGIQIGEERKLDLMSKITLETNPIVKKQLQQQLNKIESDITNLITAEDLKISEVEEYGDNINAYKASLQTQRKRNDYMKMGVTETYSKEYIESIPHKVAQEKIKAERDWWKSQDDSKRGWFNSATNRQNANLAKEKWDNDPKNPNRIPLSPNDSGDFTQLPVESRSLFGEFLTKGDELSQQMTEQKRQFVADYLQAINRGNNRNLSNEKIKKDIDIFLKKDPDFINKYYEKGKRDVANHPTNRYFSNLITSLPVVTSTEAQLNDYNVKLDEINNSEEIKQATGKDLDFAKIEKNLKTFNADFSYDDKKIHWFGPPTTKKTITPQDLINFAIASRGELHSGKSGSGSNVLYNKAVSSLNAKYGQNNDYFVDFLSALKSNKELANQYYNVRNYTSSQKYIDVLAAKEEYLKNRGMGNTQLITSVYNKGAKEVDKASTRDRISTVLNTFKEGNMDVSEFKELMVGNKEYSPNIKIDREKGLYSLALYDGNALVKEVPITSKQLNYIKDEYVQTPQLVSKVQKQITWSGSNGTSNIKGLDPADPDAYQHAYYPATYFFQKFNRKDVLGADVKLNNMGEYNTYLYVKEGNDVVGVPYKLNKGDIYPYSFTSADEADAWLKTVVKRPGDIDNIINNSKN